VKQVKQEKNSESYPMKESKKLKGRQSTGREQPMSIQPADKADVITDLATSERPLHDLAEEVSERTDVRAGVPLPLGIYAHGGGVNFAFFSRNATRIRLELFDHPEDFTAARAIDLDPVHNRTGDVRHVWIAEIRPGQLYGYRVDGPYQPKSGHRFNFNKLLLDPFATAISGLRWRRGNIQRKPKAVAEGLGIRSILHTDYESTCASLALFGLQTDEGIIQ